MLSATSKLCANWLFVTLILAAASPAFGQLLYVGNAGDNTISAYVIDQESGLLTEILPRVNAGGSPLSIAILPSGKFAFAANAGGGAGSPNLATFAINPTTGALTFRSSSPVPPGSGPQSVALDPAGRFAYVALSLANAVAVFSIDAATGATTPISGSPFATPGPVSIVVHPNGKFAYVASSGASSIAVFAIGANGALTPAAGSPFPARGNIPGMAMDRAGKFLYVAERQDNAVLAYAVNDTTGALTPIAGSPFAANAAGISGVAVDAAGKYLYESSIGASSVTVFNIGATGALSQPRNFGAILTAFSVILDPSGKFLYVPGQQANAVEGFALDPATGAPTPLPRSFFPAGVQPMRGATVLLSPPVTPPFIVESALNQFSTALPGMPNAGIAQGSRLAISGQNIGPAAALNSPPDDSSPLGTELGGVSVQIQSGDVTTAAWMIHAESNYVTCVVPSTTPLGDATVTLTYKGQTSPPLPITVVASAPGIHTLNGQGSGPSKAWNAGPDVVTLSQTDIQTPNNMSQSAKPGEYVVVHSTGLGPVTFDESQNVIEELDVPLNVIVGSRTVAAAGTVRNLGTDYVLVKLPDDTPEGCYVPVAVQLNGVTSNVGSISVAAGGGSCSDPSGLAAADIDAARQSKQIRMGTIDLSHVDFGPFGTDESADAIFARYDFNSLLSSTAPGNSGPGLRPSFSIPPAGTCSLTRGGPTNLGDPFTVPADPIGFVPLNPGTVLNLSTPKGPVQLQPPFYTVDRDGGLLGAGDYSVDNGAGSALIGAFKSVLNVPPMLNWTNRDGLVSVDRTQDLTLTWTGGDPAKEMAVIAGVAASRQVTLGFLCVEKVTAGKFTVPAWVLSSLPKSDLFPSNGLPIPGGLVGIGTLSLTETGRFSANGLDFGVFRYEQVTINPLLYQ